ncbi:hypothetical protein ACW9HJ_01280 [Nocardia gipuzkoensis]
MERLVVPSLMQSPAATRRVASSLLSRAGANDHPVQAGGACLLDIENDGLRAGCFDVCDLIGVPDGGVDFVATRCELTAGQEGYLSVPTDNDDGAHVFPSIFFAGCGDLDRMQGRALYRR